MKGFISLTSADYISSLKEPKAITQAENEPGGRVSSIDHGLTLILFWSMWLVQLYYTAHTTCLGWHCSLWDGSLLIINEENRLQT